MGRSPMSMTTESEGLKKGPWTPQEDKKLVDYIQKYGQGNWQLLPKRAGLNRCGKSCRLRWTNYLRPDIKRGNFSSHEQQTIIHLHSTLGNKWSIIATHLPGRTDNEIKNYYNTHLRKKLLLSGIDPNTHQPLSNFSSILNLINPIQNLAKIRLLSTILHLLNSTSLPEILNMENVNLSSNYQPVLGGENSGIISSNVNLEYGLPQLVQAGPEISSGEHIHCVDQSMQMMNQDQLMVSESWATMVDEDGGSFWKDVFDDSFLAASI